MQCQGRNVPCLYHTIPSKTLIQDQVLLFKLRSSRLTMKGGQIKQLDLDLGETRI